MQLSIPVYSSILFTWSANAAVTDITDLTALRSPWSKIWSDRPEEGFEVESAKTHKRILFVRGREERDREGDLTGWNFISSCGKFKILVVND